MNKTKLSQRLSARTQFKSLLVLTLLAGHASAQQAMMPSVTLEMPTLAPVECTTAPPKLDLSMPPTLDAIAPSLVQLPPATKLSTTESTWTLRQHATWLLGLKPRQVTSNSVEPSLPEVPHVDILSAAQALPQLPDLSELPQVPAEAMMPVDAAVSAEFKPAEFKPTELKLVQHTEPSAIPALGTPTTETAAVTPAIHAQDDADKVSHAHQPIPMRLNRSPVITGPAPALPTDKWDSESLLQVDVSGVDVSKLSSAPAAAESLIDGLSLPTPVGPAMPGFTMRDNGSASVAASPSRAKPVSIHEGFSPRVSAANQPAHLTLGDGDASEPADRLRVSVPAAPKYSLSDKAGTTSSGPIVNRFSDSSAVHEKLDDKGPSKKDVASKPAVEKSFSDKDPILASLPVEVSTDSDKTSRAGKPLVLTPPPRLDKESPLPLPLSAVSPIASTGVGAAVPAKPSKTTEAETKNFLGNKPAAAAPALASTPTTETSQDSLLDSVTIPPSLLSSTGLEQEFKAQESSDTVAKTDTTRSQTSTKPAASGVITKAEPAKPTLAAKQTNTKQTNSKLDNAFKPAHASQSPEKMRSDKTQAEKVAFSDSNPIALKRPVVKATNVAISEVFDNESTVVQSSHEMDDTSRQVAEYAKTAAKLQQALRQKFPNMRVKISCNEDGLIVEGNVANNVEAGKILSFVRKSSLCPVADRITTSQ